MVPALLQSPCSAAWHMLGVIGGRSESIIRHFRKVRGGRRRLVPRNTLLSLRGRLDLGGLLD